MYLAGHDSDLKLYQRGSMPQDDFSQGPSDHAYRNFLLWQYGELAKEVQVLFDPENVASKLFPRPRVLREIIEALNTDDLKDAWGVGNEETIGWVYQFFNAEEKDAAFDRVFKRKRKFQKSDIPAATQVFTPRWIVKFLVQNSLGRLWLSIHPDSQLAGGMEYLVPLAGEPSVGPRKSVKDIRILDPATGTMHFGLVAFDLLVKMYQEEMAKAGNKGWPNQPPVSHEEEIPAAILGHNLFGIDIDLRAVQLAAMALYLRAKSYSRSTVLTESNLACADVALFRGAHRSKIAAEMALPRGLTRELFDQFCDTLDEASLMGSLVRVEKLFQEKLRADELKVSIDAYVRNKAAEGIDESYFGGETAKGLRLLDVLIRRYDVVFTNPPYMSNRNMSIDMSDFMKRNYKKSKGDLYTGFIERCAELLVEGGRVAMITQQSFMYISTFEDLRMLLLDNLAIETMAHVGPHAFAEVQGEKVNTSAYVLRRESLHDTRRDSTGVYLRLVRESDPGAKRKAFEQALSRHTCGDADPRVFLYRQGDFAAIPGSPWVYQITSGLRAVFERYPPLGSLYPAREGINTGDNERFLRFWWEVALAGGVTNQTWCRIAKGDRTRRFINRSDYAVVCDTRQMELLPGSAMRNRDYFFKPGITFLSNSSSRFCAWKTPPDHLFCSTGGRSLFPPSNHIASLLGVLNSKVVHQLLSLINPTITIKVGDLNRLPVPTALGAEIEQLATCAISTSISLSEGEETNYDFVAPVDWLTGAKTLDELHETLAVAEERIDEEVYSIYGISEDDRNTIEHELTDLDVAEGELEDADTEEGGSVAPEVPFTVTELAKSWISYAVGLALGRFHPGVQAALGCGRFNRQVVGPLTELSNDPVGILVLEEGHPEDLAQRVIEVLHILYGDAETEKIVRAATSGNGTLRQALESYLLGSFFREHVKLYRKRPVYWLLQSPARGFSVYLFHQRATDNTLSLLQGKKYLGGRIHHLESAFQHAKEMEGSTLSSVKTGWAKNARELAELLEDLRAFDQQIAAANNVLITDRDGQPKTVRWKPEFDDGVLLNAAPLHELTPAWRRVDAKLDLTKVWKDMEKGEYNWSKTAMRYWPQQVLKDCRKDKSFAIAQGLA
jgi:hypothetical protein